MKYQVKGVMKESGREVETTVDAKDDDDALALANAYGILPSNIRLLDVLVPSQPPMSTTPVPPKAIVPDPLAKTLGRLSVVSGALSFLAATILFGSLAIIGGAVAVRRGTRLGWLGIGLGAAGIAGRLAITLLR